MWLRDAALEGKVPTCDDAGLLPVVPYRYGQAPGPTSARAGATRRWERSPRPPWPAGSQPAFRRTTGLSLDQLVDQWRDAVQKQYLPEVGDRVRARAMATPLLTEKKSQGTYHLAPVPAVE